MEITAQDVAKLREITGVGLMACKKALVATNGDIDKACEIGRASCRERVLRLV